eukprot:3053412-Amphidinium_carterae.1
MSNRLHILTRLHHFVGVTVSELHTYDSDTTRTFERPGAGCSLNEVPMSMFVTTLDVSVVLAQENMLSCDPQRLEQIMD